MPELPEVETVRRGLWQALAGVRIMDVVVRRTDLRWPVAGALLHGVLPGQRIEGMDRRGKVLLLRTAAGTVLIHLGMSGVLRVVSDGVVPGRHDHVDFVLEGRLVLRLTDSRRFGAVLWGGSDPLRHELVSRLGPEPLAEEFDGSALHARIRMMRRAIKMALMDGRVVAGIGNIYAVESLFRAGIHPATQAASLRLETCSILVSAIKDRLTAAIRQGGTTLRDFRRSDGRPGYFQQSLLVYGREGACCRECGGVISSLRLGGRASPFCPCCQPPAR
ncbi:MAG: bifunctional DNA-formamidopyrimidine glycosylase/DNA-(apurinic or apyrimidinic site) lyase [Magnetococcales bacterium]|nr:bifunctional DNA-formamidopyrimidine glycosylase/DNA-(apurinic or apyrimidinic site) lyase [Magnetococcales bacterium]